VPKNEESRIAKLFIDAPARIGATSCRISQASAFRGLQNGAGHPIGNTLKRFHNYGDLIKIARCGFPWEKTT
jgi:hypothetical protein